LPHHHGSPESEPAAGYCGLSRLLDGRVAGPWFCRGLYWHSTVVPEPQNVELEPGVTGRGVVDGQTPRQLAGCLVAARASGRCTSLTPARRPRV
jgi:hypothetical protein